MYVQVNTHKTVKFTTRIFASMILSVWFCFLHKSREILPLRFNMHKIQMCSIRNQLSIISHLAHNAAHYITSCLVSS